MLFFFFLFSTGLYLFIILIFTFVSEKRVKLSLYFIGWGLPLAVILVYVVCRASLAEPEDANTIDRYEQICGKYIHTSLAVFYNRNKFQEDFFFKICELFSSSSFSCWAIDVSVNWIYKIPCIVSVCANLIFLLVIVFKLVSNFYTDMSDNAAVMRTFKAIGMNYINSNVLF